MLASAMLSMWVSNTATTLMLLPVAYAVLDSADSESAKPLAVALFLGIAYAASIGGLGTPIGSPPNVVFLKIYGETTGTIPSFGQWMLWSIPVVVSAATGGAVDYPAAGPVGTTANPRHR